jgi:electron transfer flavoprotein beta subunit
MRLNVAVLVKQVPDHEAMVHVKSDQELDIEERYVCSFFDEIAIEAALTIRKTHPETELRALSAGGRRAVDALRRAMAMGIDLVERIGDERLDGADSLCTATVLAARLRVLQPDLVICGRQACDDDMAAVAPMVAELLGVPHVSAIVSLDLQSEEGTVRAQREADGELWVLESRLPVVVTAEKGLAEPHIPLVTRVMKAMRATIPNVSLEELKLAAPEPGRLVRRLRYAAPPTRPPVTMIDLPFPENVHELVRTLQERGVLS